MKKTKKIKREVEKDVRKLAPNNVLVVKNSEFNLENAKKLAKSTNSTVILVTEMDSIKSIYSPAMEGMELYKELKVKGFPQGGQGPYYVDPKTSERFYKPTPDEIYTQFIADPAQWDSMVDAMVRVWIQNKK